MFRAKEKTKSHRHTSTRIYHAFRGSGTTITNGRPVHWLKDDTFTVPLWS
jgi:gentisate 1,2-dioxygenase